MRLHLRALVVLAAGALACTALPGCEAGDDDDSPDNFDPSGTYQGPGSLVGNDGAHDVATGEEDQVLLSTTAVSIGVNCSLTLKTSADVGVDDHGSSDDVVRYFGKVQSPVAGQSCTLGGEGATAITFVVSDGLVTTWRASPVSSMDLSLTGTTAAGGSLTYRFSGLE
jgi:hypothetical protein